MAKRRTYLRKFQPNPDQPLTLRQVSDALLAIWDGHTTRLPTRWGDKQPYGEATPNENAKNFLRREIYALGLALKTNPPEWEMADLIKLIRGKPVTRPEVLGRVFHALFLALYEDDDGIDRHERRMLAKELEYAYRHEVPPEYLCGFIHQSGGRKNLSIKLEDGYVEPAFVVVNDGD